MIVLSSNGLSSSVTTASVPYKERDRHIPRISEELHAIGLSKISLVDVEFAPAETLLSFDAVLLNGGNPFYLLNQLRRSNAAPVLRTLAARGLLIGVSAGSLVLQEDIRLAASYSPEMNGGVGLQDLRGLALTKLEVLPHYHRFLPRFSRFEERAAAFERESGRTVLRIDDGQAVFDTLEGPYIAGIPSRDS